MISPAWGFLLVFHSNQYPNMHHIWAKDMEQTDRQLDKCTALCTLLILVGGGITVISKDTTTP